RDLLRRRTLLLDRRGDRRGDGVDAADRLVDAGHRLDGTLGGALDGIDLADDVFRRLRGLPRQRLDLGGDHGEALAGLAGARRLDGGVERQQIGLRRDVVDEPHDFADALRRVVELFHIGGGRGGVFHRLRGDLARMRDLPPDLADRGRHLLGRRGDGLHIGARLARGGRDGRCLAARLLGDLAHAFRGGAHLGRSRAQAAQRFARRALELPDRSLDAALTLVLQRLLLALLRFERARLAGVLAEDDDGG